MTSSNGNLFRIWAGHSPVTSEFPAKRPATRSFDVIFDLRLNERLSKQSWGWWFETQWHPLWRHCNVNFRWSQWQGFRRYVAISVAASDRYSYILLSCQLIINYGMLCSKAGRNRTDTGCYIPEHVGIVPIPASTWYITTCLQSLSWRPWLLNRCFQEYDIW